MLRAVTRPGREFAVSAADHTEGQGWPAMLSVRKIWSPGGPRGWQDMEQEPQPCWHPTNNHTFKRQPNLQALPTQGSLLQTVHIP